MSKFIAIAVAIFLAFAVVRAEGAEPKRIVPAGGSVWTNPVSSPDGKAVAFTDEFHREIRVYVSGEDSSRRIIRGPSLGSRYVFDSSPDPRLVYRNVIEFMPQKPERLFSSSIYMFDPINRTSNSEGRIFGPYFIEGQVWYRFALDAPLLNYDGQLRVAGPRWNREHGRLWVLNEKADTVWSSPTGARMAGAEISPDGRWIAAVAAEPRTQLTIVRIEDGLVTDGDSGFAPAWSGDSRWIAYVSRQDNGRVELRLLGVPDGARRVVLSSPHFSPETPTLNHDGTRCVFVSEGALWAMDVNP
ncbi:hypothetical protein KKH27_01705 [bacterium]|nr:hypothetical protein [bacterium]MBU1983432.1 hypothetical protein [bacterium]